MTAAMIRTRTLEKAASENLGIVSVMTPSMPRNARPNTVHDRSSSATAEPASSRSESTVLNVTVVHIGSATIARHCLPAPVGCRRGAMATSGDRYLVRQHEDGVTHVRSIPPEPKSLQICWQNNRVHGRSQWVRAEVGILR